MANLLRQYGFKSIAIERRFPYTLKNYRGQTIKLRYRVDLYAVKGDRKIAIEVNGYMGHKSRLALGLDELRTRRIQEAYGPIEFHRITFSRLAHWTDKEIAEEMRL